MSGAAENLTYLPKDTAVPDTMAILLPLAQQKELNHLVAKTNFTEVARTPV